MGKNRFEDTDSIHTPAQQSVNVNQMRRAPVGGAGAGRRGWSVLAGKSVARKRKVTEVEVKGVKVVSRTESTRKTVM